jgi:predicted DNA-binding transcriptional regulator AlpA
METNLEKTISPEHTAQLPILLTQIDLAEYLSKSTAWCERARWSGTGPKYIKLGRHVRYKAADVLEWIEENSKSSTSDGGQ